MCSKWVLDHFCLPRQSFASQSALCLHILLSLPPHPSTSPQSHFSYNFTLLSPHIPSSPTISPVFLFFPFPPLPPPFSSGPLSLPIFLSLQLSPSLLLSLTTHPSPIFPLPHHAPLTLLPSSFSPTMHHSPSPSPLPHLQRTCTSSVSLMPVCEQQ